MTAYLIGHITVRDPEAWSQYVDGVRFSLLPYDAEVLFRGRRSEILAGSHDHELTVVIRFADQDTLRSWFLSDTYQALIPLRDRAADVSIISYDDADGDAQ